MAGLTKTPTTEVQKGHGTADPSQPPRAERGAHE
jgi:hypothetical protein